MREVSVISGFRYGRRVSGFDCRPGFRLTMVSLVWPGFRYPLAVDCRFKCRGFRCFTENYGKPIKSRVFSYQNVSRPGFLTKRTGFDQKSDLLGLLSCGKQRPSPHEKINTPEKQTPHLRFLLQKLDPVYRAVYQCSNRVYFVLDIGFIAYFVSFFVDVVLQCL